MNSTIFNTKYSTLNSTMLLGGVVLITANELKTKGASLLKKAINEDGNAIISVHGEEVFVVLPIQSYNTLREFELEKAIKESEEDIKNGKYHTDGVEAHMKRMGLDV